MVDFILEKVCGSFSASTTLGALPNDRFTVDELKSTEASPNEPSI